LDASAFEDLAWWVEKDRTQALRIIRLIRDVLRGETIEGRSLAPAS
jgi:Txe/YoeB family toxin of Txe-Axe toxin-antitoxin module